MNVRGKSTINIDSIYGPIEAFENDLITDQILSFGNHTRPEFSFALSAIDCDTNVFDLGAHIGTFSLPTLKKLKDPSQLLALEGSPEIFSVLDRNIKSKGYQKAHTFNAYMAHNNNYVYHENTSNTGGGYIAPKRAGDSSIEKHVNLDELAQKFFVPDFIKMDIEGMEFSILSHSDMLVDQKPIIYMEVNIDLLSRNGQKISGLNKLLKNSGYGFFVNIGDRNGKHDFYRAKQIRSLNWYKNFFDVLCVPSDSDAYLALQRTCHTSMGKNLYDKVRFLSSRMLPEDLKIYLKKMLHM